MKQRPYMRRDCPPAYALVPWLCFGVAAIVAGLGALAANAQIVTSDTKPTEFEVEAAYLSNFGRFAEWQHPLANGESFEICVLGQDPFGSLLDSAVKGENIGGAPVAARLIASVEGARSCRIVFISQSLAPRLTEVLKDLGAMGVLTVSDISGFTRRGGIIEFVLQEKKVRFEINIAAAQRAGITLSSQLLKLSTSVRRSP